MADNEVFIGQKNPMSYVLAMTKQATENDSIKLKARGKTISKAVDVSQISINQFLKDWKVTNVEIGTEELPYREREGEKKQDNKDKQKTQRVSYIEIELKKGE